MKKVLVTGADGWIRFRRRKGADEMGLEFVKSQAPLFRQSL